VPSGQPIAQVTIDSKRDLIGQASGGAGSLLRSLGVERYFFYLLDEMPLALGEFEQIVLLAIPRLGDGA
jgi:hypothetical protein